MFAESSEPDIVTHLITINKNTQEPHPQNSRSFLLYSLPENSELDNDP